MITITIILILLLSGCSGISLKELEEQSYACGLEKSPECSLIAEELEKRYKHIDEMIERQEKRECMPGAKCYYGYDAYTILNKRR